MIIDYQSVRKPALDVTQAALLPAGLRTLAYRSLPQWGAVQTGAFVPMEDPRTASAATSNAKPQNVRQRRDILNYRGIVLPSANLLGRVNPYASLEHFREFEIE